MPVDVCVPLEDSTTGADILTRALRVLIGELLRIGPDAAASHGRRAELAMFQSILRVVARTSPGALAALARLPNVGALVRSLRMAPDAATRDAWAGELALVVATELALGGALPEEIAVSAPPRRIVALGRRATFLIPADARCVTASPSGALHVDDVTTPLQIESPSPFHAIHNGLVLATVDNNPLHMVEAHPDKRGNAVDLGGRAASEWTASTHGALETIAQHLPAFRREIDLFVRQIVPVGYDEETHLSASYREAIGTLYLSLHPSALTMVEAIIHETSHNKLNALIELDPLLENDSDERHASPVRPDGRPLLGVLLAVHAFLPVAALYESMLRSREDAGVRARYEAVRRMNAEGAAVLALNARPTALGRTVLQEIEERVRL